MFITFQLLSLGWCKAAKQPLDQGILPRAVVTAWIRIIWIILICFMHFLQIDLERDCWFFTPNVLPNATFQRVEFDPAAFSILIYCSHHWATRQDSMEYVPSGEESFPKIKVIRALRYNNIRLFWFANLELD